MMYNLFTRSLRRPSALFLAVVLVLAGCDRSPTQPEPPAGIEAAVVVNSRDFSLTVIPVEDPTATFMIGVSPEGSPTTLAVRGGMAVVPLGTYPFAAVVDLQARQVTHTVALPEGSGATGAAFLNDSIALVANPRLNSVTPINVRRGTALAEIPVSVYPQRIIVRDGRAYVLNSELENFVPVRPAVITIIDSSLQVTGTIQLSGLNPGGAEFAPDGRLYVINQGRWKHDNGSLSVVDVNARQEVSHHPGFGNFPGAIALTPNGQVMVGLYGTGILTWNPATRQFTRGLDNPITPGNVPPVSAVGFDSTGQLHVLSPGNCQDPGVAYRLGSDMQVAGETATGICPFGLAFTRLPER